jgi:glycosyltransferase involved in cell wall biosynthesis
MTSPVRTDTISVVIPAYNEEARLPGTLQAVLRHLAEGQWESAELIVVDDGSTDNTALLVDEARFAHPNVRLVSNRVNRGKGYSVRHGILEAQGDWILFTDADLSAPIGELDTLLEAAHAHDAAVVFGSRAVDPSLIDTPQSGTRRLAGRCFNLLVRLLTGLRFQDTQCGFKLFRADAGRAICRRQRIARWGFDVEQLYLARRLGYRAVEVGVHWAHADGSKVRMVRDSLNMLGDLLRIRWHDLTGLYR